MYYKIEQVIKYLGLVSATVALTLASVQVRAQDGEAIYMVNYFEVFADRVQDTLALIRDHRDVMRATDGNLHGEFLQGMGRPNQFVVLATWRDQASLDTYRSTVAEQRFQERLRTLLIAPYDEREHLALDVLPDEEGEATVYAVTHVDFIPTGRDQGVGMLRSMIANSRQQPGSIRFNALVQANRANHISLVEAWSNEASRQAHEEAAYKRNFRFEMMPFSGSLYDERLYRPIP